MNIDELNQIKDLVIVELQRDYFLVPRRLRIDTHKKDDFLIHLLDYVCRHKEINPTDIVEGGRHSNILAARNLFFYMAKKIFFDDVTLKQLGSFAGGKDHATVLSAINKMEDQMSVDKAFKAQVHTFINEFKDWHREQIFNIEHPLISTENGKEEIRTNGQVIH